MKRNVRRKTGPQAKVVIVMGSESDREVMKEAALYLDRFGVPHEIVVSSAHRNPARTRALARGAIRRGVEVFIVGAGMSAHLPGAIAAETTLPIIGVPLASSHLAGQDALLSIVQMPTGVPVATMAIGVAGARNAAILAVQILALGNPTVRAALRRYKTGLAR